MPDYRRRASREAMSVRLDVNGMMADMIGEGGVRREEVDGLAGRATEWAAALKTRRSGGEFTFYDLPSQKEALTPIKALAAAVRAESNTLVVLGIAGSALGSRALVTAVGDATPTVHIADNVDPWGFGRLLDTLDLGRTTFNVVSKSGETAETMAQFLIVRDLLLRALGAVDYSKHIVVTTDAESGALRQVIHDEGFRDLVIPSAVPGRFSALTAACLFPAATAGVRVDDVLAGAAWMDQRCSSLDLWQNPAYLLATLLYLADTRRRRNVLVMMPYSDRLQGLAAWFAQLWAESLGKARNLEGVPVHTGQTPVIAATASDQHSQMQLYAEGPADKVIIMVRVEDHGRELPVPSAYTDLEGIGYLGSTGLGQLLNLEQRAGELLLLKLQRPVITVTLPQINAFTFGQLFYVFEAAAAFAGGLYDVNAFDQPSVEDRKQLMYGLLGRQGFEVKRTEAEAWSARKQSAYIL